MGCAALVFCWQLLTVHYNYQGHWTGLFCTGSKFRQPPQLAGERIYLFPKSSGYDGQFYHYMAHDPFLRRGFEAYVEGAGLRYRRILIPAAAYALAFGQDRYVDGAYVAVILLTIFWGAYWLSCCCVLAGFNAVWGLCFALVPGTITSIDRLTLDGPLAALCIGFALYVARSSRWRTFGILLAAALLRETGLLLAAGYVLYLLWKRAFRPAFLFATAALPALAWYAFVIVHTKGETNHWFSFAASGQSWFSLVPFKALVIRLLHPNHYPLAAGLYWLVTVLDYIALLGVAIAILMAASMAWRRLVGPVELCIYLYALMAALLSFQDVWTEAYGFGRILSPLLVLLAVRGLPRRQWLSVVPIVLVAMRTTLQLAPQTLQILERAL